MAKFLSNLVTLRMLAISYSVCLFLFRVGDVTGLNMETSEELQGPIL